MSKHAFLLVTLLAACGWSSDVVMTSARPMAAQAPVAHGDCVEARKRAAADHQLYVDEVPAPVKMAPPPFPRALPASVRKNVDEKGMALKTRVMVDTLGRPDMKTFTVVESSNAWFAERAKTAMGKWKFKPAKLAGCKVPRIYEFSATAPAKTQKARRG